MIPEQIAFLTSLFILGMFFALLFYPKISAFLACLFGFILGSIIYLVFAIFVLEVKFIPYNAVSMVIFEALTLTSLLALLIKKKTFRELQRNEIVFIIGYLLVFEFINWFFCQHNYSKTSFDSVILVSMGRYIAAGEWNSWIIGSPKAYGILIPILHSSSSFWGIDYYSSLQPTIMFSFVGIFVYGNLSFLKSIITNYAYRIAAVIISAVLFFSTPMIMFNVTYIHTNFISAVYLFSSLLLFMRSTKRKTNEEIALGTIILLGFGFCRTENSLFALIILLLFFSYSQLTYRKRFAIAIPYSLVFIIWWFLVYQMKGVSFSDVMDESILYAYFLIFVCFMIGIAISKNKWIEKNIIYKFDKWILLTLSFVFVAMIVIKPSHMWLSILNTLKNLIFTKNGGYGFTFVFLFLCTVFLTIARILKKEIRFTGFELLDFSILSFVLFVLIMGFLRTPYRIGWGDSANRMFVEVLPLMISSIFVKVARYLFLRKKVYNADSTFHLE